MYLKWSIDIDGFTRIIRFEDSSLEEVVTKKEKNDLRKRLRKEQDSKRKEREHAAKKLAKEQ